MGRTRLRRAVTSETVSSIWRKTLPFQALVVSAAGSFESEGDRWNGCRSTRDAANPWGYANRERSDEAHLPSKGRSNGSTIVERRKVKGFTSRKQISNRSGNDQLPIRHFFFGAGRFAYEGWPVSNATARRLVVGTLRIVEIAVTSWSAVAHNGVNSRVAGPHMGQSRLINASLMGVAPC